MRPGLTPIPAPEGSRDAGVPWHYGNPFAEQRRLAAGEAVVNLSHRGVLTVTGPDRLTWLHSLTTQHLAELPAHVWTTALILSPHGHVEHELHLVDDGATTWITTEPGDAESLRAYLDSMRFMLRVEVADVTADYGVVYDGHEIIVPRSDVDQRLGDEPAGTWALEALRVAAGVPRMNHETDHRTIPHEVGWIETAVHLQKGCYRGQETVARVQNLGRPPRRMVLLHLDGSDNVLPAHLDPVLLDGKQVGWIGTAVQHYELGPIATAIIKRTVPENADLVVRTADGDIAASQQPLT